MKPKILIVDDEPDAISLLQLNLAMHGYDVQVGRTGLDALHPARRHLPDLVILDLMMDGIDGYTVCEILRSELSTANIPIIMLTALFGQLTRANCLAAGANDFLVKPYNQPELLRRINAVLDQHRKVMQALHAQDCKEAALERLTADTP
jgi:two-component system phosphate regulon response regulator PhoB